MSLSDDPRSNLGARAQRIDKPVHLVHICTTEMSCQLLPYEDESTASRPICKVKHLTAQSVLRWGTTWEYCGVAISFCQFLQSDRYRESVAERVLARPVRRLANFCSSRDRVAWLSYEPKRFCHQLEDATALSLYMELLWFCLMKAALRLDLSACTVWEDSECWVLIHSSLSTVFQVPSSIWAQELWNTKGIQIYTEAPDLGQKLSCSSISRVTVEASISNFEKRQLVQFW